MNKQKGAVFFLKCTGIFCKNYLVKHVRFLANNLTIAGLFCFMEYAIIVIYTIHTFSFSE